MIKPNSRYQWVLWGMLGFSFCAIGGLYVLSQAQQKAVDEQITWVNFPLADFTLTNQNGKAVTLAELRGQVWVADIVFTRCAGPCPVMTQRLSDLQSTLTKDARVRLVTLTTDPEYDTPPVMKRFGERFSANFARWDFLTGDKKEIARLAVDGMMLVAIPKNAVERENPQDLFIHSTRFVVVDKKGVVRASLDSDEPMLANKLMRAVKKLLRE